MSILKWRYCNYGKEKSDSLFFYFSAHKAVTSFLLTHLPIVQSNVFYTVAFSDPSSTETEKTLQDYVQRVYVEDVCPPDTWQAEIINLDFNQWPKAKR